VYSLSLCFSLWWDLGCVKPSNPTWYLKLEVKVCSYFWLVRR
jgi:hypothetical protein